MAKMKKDKLYAELGRVGGGRTPELTRLLQRFHELAGSSLDSRKKLVNELRDYVATQFPDLPRPNAYEASEFAQASAKDMDMPRTAALVRSAVIACVRATPPEASRKTTSSDDGEEPGANHALPLQRKAVRDEHTR